MKPTTILTASCALLLNSVASAQDGGPVSRAEYNKLKKEMAEMRAQMQQLLKERAPAPIAAGPSGRTSLAERTKSPIIGELTEKVDALSEQVKETFPGTTNFLFGGYAAGGFTSQKHSDSFFTANFNPIFLWKMSDRLIFEGELELELEGGETKTKLELAQISYVLNDYMTVGAGKFLNPANYFVERQHMAWVNKLPDKPLAVYDGLMPESNVGVQLRGVIPLGPTKLEYAAYVSNAPFLDQGPADPSQAGPFGDGFDNFDNVDGHIAVGGHVGFLPIPELEIGYGIQSSKVGPRESSVRALLHSVDLSYTRDSEMLKGMINVRGQWIWSNVGSSVYDADGSQGYGPLTFSNKRSGGYAQIAYRPTKFGNDFIKNLEPVFRYDRLNQDRTPVGFNEQRYTIGLNYWLGPSTVLKAAYEIDDKSNNFQSANAWLFQFATGF